MHIDTLKRVSCEPPRDEPEIYYSSHEVQLSPSLHGNRFAVYFPVRGRFVRVCPAVQTFSLGLRKPPPVGFLNIGRMCISNRNYRTDTLVASDYRYISHYSNLPEQPVHVSMPRALTVPQPTHFMTTIGPRHMLQKRSSKRFFRSCLALQIQHISCTVTSVFSPEGPSK